MKSRIIKIFLSIVLQIGIFLAAVSVPRFEFDFDATTILNSVALLFTILIGFFIAAATSNYLRLQSLISNEDAKLISIFGLIRLIQPAAAKSISNLIDKYMISVLDYDLLGYTSSTTKEFNDLVKAIDSVRASNEMGNSLIQNLHSIKSEMISIRQESLVSFKRTVSSFHWSILVSLAVVISLILLGLRGNSEVAPYITGVILVALYQALSLLHKIDSHTFLADRIAYENPQYVFMAIGKKKYYPEDALSEKRKKSLRGEDYRVGVYKNRAKSLEKTIKIIKA